MLAKDLTQDDVGQFFKLISLNVPDNYYSNNWPIGKVFELLELDPESRARCFATLYITYKQILPPQVVPIDTQAELEPVYPKLVLRPSEIDYEKAEGYKYLKTQRVYNRDYKGISISDISLIMQCFDYPQQDRDMYAKELIKLFTDIDYAKEWFANTSSLSLK